MLRAGLGLYDLLAGNDGLGAAALLDVERLRAALPGLHTDGLTGGVSFHDAQFDDAGLALALARTASAHGALVLNHCALHGLVVEGGRIRGAALQDAESGRSFRVSARVVINAAGVWGDGVRRLADPLAPALLRPSQGVHLVVDADCLPGGDALLVPHTDDGRVLFMIPWLGKVLIGTTDSARADAPDEPEPVTGEIDFLLRAAAQWLRRPPAADTVRSVFVGLRPLLGAGEGGASSRLSREHRIEVMPGGLVSVLGGKWTTYRLMAEQAVDRAEEVCGLSRQPSPTARLRLDCDGVAAAVVNAAGGACGAGALLEAGLVRRAVREEFALGLEDVLARRSRALFLDAQAAAAAAPAVADILAAELGWSAVRRTAELAAFTALAERYRTRSVTTASSPPSG